MDGRDIGTVALPDADLKIFLTATAEARAKRRWLELKEKGMEQAYEDVLRDVIWRDKNDSERDVAPLKPAEDSMTVDTTELDLQQSIELIERLIRERLGV
jgi:cytidylate kinase